MTAATRAWASGTGLHAIAAQCPAPTLAGTTFIRRWGIYLGSINHLEPHVHVPVCAHTTCRRTFTARLDHRRTRDTATGALVLHWDERHRRKT